VGFLYLFSCVCVEFPRQRTRENNYEWERFECFHISSSKDSLLSLGMSSSGKKKLVIKFTAPTAIPDTYEKDTWSKLQAAIRAVHERRPVDSNLEELYNDVKNLCSNQKAKPLYDNLRVELYQHLQGTLRALATHSGSETYLQQLDDVWQSHCEQMRMIRSIFLYLDRSYVLHASAVRSLWNLGLDIFQEHFIGCQLAERTVAGILALIKAERSGEAVTRSLIQSLVRMLSSLDLYSSMFESEFLRATELFYLVEGDDKLEHLDVSLYLRHVERRIQEENERLVYYLDPTTKKGLLSTVQKQLLERHLDNILSRGLTFFSSCFAPV
jgi:cullin-4